jgi:serine/threonine-protein kinase RsbW
VSVFGSAMRESPMSKMVIPSRLTELPGVQEAVIREAEALGYGKEEVFAIRLSLDEAVTNAIHHGNCNDPEKQVAIEYQVDEQAVRITVSDEGEGFCPEELPDPTLEDNLATPSGRGVMLIQVYMTEVTYNPCGNSISMVKRKGCKLPAKD